MSVLLCAFYLGNSISAFGVATNEVGLDKSFQTIQSAIDKAKAGDVVLVYPGTYKENIDFKGKNVTVGSLFSLMGDSLMITNTVIDGGANGLPVVAFQSHETAAAQLVGLTITNGLNPGGGGGILISVASATVSHCRIVGNRAASAGGINIYYADPSLQINFCSFEGNDATGSGGAIYMFASNVLIESCSFTGNSAGDKGSAIFWYGRGSVQVRHCLFEKNSGPTVLSIPGVENGGQSQLINCTLFSNSVSVASVRSLGTCFVVNSILQDNAAKQINVDGVVFLDYNVVKGGSNSVSATVAGAIHYGTNNISTPVIFDASSRVLDGFPRLDSTIIGAGTAQIGFPGATIVTSGKDAYGNNVPNPPGSPPDIGAIELPYAGPLALVVAPVVANWKFGQATSVKLEANNNPQEFDYANLPVGLLGDRMSGVISGIPLKVGTNVSLVLVKNKWGLSTNAIQLIVERGVPNISWNPPKSITWGGALDTNIYSAVSSVPGQFSYEPLLGTVLEVGTRMLKGNFTPSDPDNYETVNVTRQVNVVKADQQVDFNPPREVVLGDGPITLAALSSSGLPVRFQVVFGAGKLVGNSLQVVGGGTIGLVALQDGDAHYNPAPSVNRSVEVKLRPQVIQTAGGKTIREPTTDTFTYGTPLTVTAIPDDGFLFDGWQGVTSKENPLTVPVISNLRIEAVFNPRWTLTLSTTAGGSVISEPATNALKNGSAVAVSALPDNGYGFRGWEGTFTTKTNPLDFVLNTNVNLTGVFARIVKLTVDQTDGGKITVTPLMNQYLNGDEMTVAADAEEGYRFGGWTGPLAGRPAKVSLVLSNDLTLGAVFKKLQKVVLTQSGEGTVEAVNGLFHDVGEFVTVKANPAQGWVFTGWEGATKGTNNPITTTVTTTTALRAVFKHLWTFSLRVIKGGVVEVNPNQTAYIDGAVITLLAKPERYYRFDRWTGGLSGTNSPTTLALTTNVVIEAVFVPSHRLVPTPAQNMSLGFKMRAEGEPGTRYVIEVSSALQSWTPLVTITNETGVVEFLDQQARALSRRFYRLRTVE